VMARSVAKCSVCGDLLWFGELDIPPQAVQCICGGTILKETGPEGSPDIVTAEDLQYVADEEAKTR